MLIKKKCIVAALFVLFMSAGCAKEKVAVTPENSKTFTGPAMPADARARMAQEQAKAMAKMGAGAPPQSSPSAATK